MFLFICICYIVGALSLPTTESQWADRRPLTEQDYQTLHNLPRIRLSRELPAGFKRVFVDQTGLISDSRVSKDQLEVDGSPKTSIDAVRQAARLISKMTKYMPRPMFRQLCDVTVAGVFTRKEKLTIYPQFAGLKNGNCGKSCAGDCSFTCTFDGRKWEDTPGIGGVTALVVDDNLMCTANDPYGHKENILIHELSHTINQYAMNYSMQASVRDAYLQAKKAKTWKLSSYAMQTFGEYFAEASTVFLGVNTFSRSNTGGMNWCGTTFCSSESQARSHLKAKDPKLYAILAYVFTDGHAKRLSGLTTCPST